MRISDWSSDVCSSDLAVALDVAQMGPCRLQAPLANLDDPRLDDGAPNPEGRVAVARGEDSPDAGAAPDTIAMEGGAAGLRSAAHLAPGQRHGTEPLAPVAAGSEEPTSELQSLMR